jgi:GDP-D-mannose dehydratase
MFSVRKNEVLIVDENTLPSPQNLYGQTKLEAWEICKNFRKQFGILVSCPVLFNHVSPYSKKTFLFPQVAQQIGSQLNMKKAVIRLRNIHSRIDVTSAEEVCQAIIKITGNEISAGKDYIIGSGQSNSIKNIVEEFFSVYHRDFMFELMSDESNPESGLLLSDIGLIKKDLGWSPRLSPHALLQELVRELV